MAVDNTWLRLDSIYNSDFTYSLPRNELEKYLAGNAFDHKEPYTDEEWSRLRTDINSLYDQVIPKTPSTSEHPEAILTAGGPGVGKTRLLRSYVTELKYPYIDPDDVCLKNQTKSYLADIEACDGSHEARQKLYNTWRPGSNAASHIILAHLIKEKFPFCFGTTASGPFTYKALDLLIKQGYKITILHVTSPSDICWAALKERDKIFIQTTEQDVVEKAKLVPQRINDTHLKYAHTIKFYYRDAVDKDATLAATWIRNEPDAKSLGTLAISDSPSYEAIKTIHNAVAKELQKEELLWENSVEKASQSLTEN